MFDKTKITTPEEAAKALIDNGLAVVEALQVMRSASRTEQRIDAQQTLILREQENVELQQYIIDNRWDLPLVDFTDRLTRSA